MRLQRSGAVRWTASLPQKSQPLALCICRKLTIVSLSPFVVYNALITNQLCRDLMNESRYRWCVWTTEHLHRAQAKYIPQDVCSVIAGDPDTKPELELCVAKGGQLGMTERCRARANEVAEPARWSMGGGARPDKEVGLVKSDLTVLVPSPGTPLMPRSIASWPLLPPQPHHLSLPSPL